MNGPIIVVPKYHRLGEGFSKLEKLQAQEHPGRRTTAHGYQSPASWISDLVALKKFIILCSICRVHFNPRKNGYRTAYVLDTSGKTDGYQVNGKCDGCKEMTINCGGGRGYVPEEFYGQLFHDPSQARRNARAAWKAQPVWTAIRRDQRN